jgi:hypothetical protein
MSSAEFVLSAQEIAAHPQFDSLHAIVNDFTEATGCQVDSAALESVAVIRFGSLATNARLRVLVVGTAPWVAGLVDEVKSNPLVGSHETRRFDTLAEALAWLERNPPRVSIRGIRW